MSNKLKDLFKEHSMLLWGVVVVLIVAVIAVVAITASIANQPKTGAASVENDVKQTVANIEKALIEVPTASSISGDSTTSPKGTVETAAGTEEFKIITSDENTTVIVGGRFDNYTVTGTNTSIDGGNQSYVYTSKDKKDEWVKK